MTSQFKTVALLALLSGLIIVLGGAVGGRGGIMIALAFALVMNIGSYWYSDKIVLSMYRARELSPQEAPMLHQIVEELAANAGVPKPRVYLVPQEAPNAFATGRNPENSAVAVTEGIMHLLSPRELRGVLAHEMAHVANRDILIQTVAGVLASAITAIANFAQFAAIFGGRDENGEGRNPLAMLLMALLAPIAATLIQMAISRTREYKADATGAELCRDPPGSGLCAEQTDDVQSAHPHAGESVHGKHVHRLPLFRHEHGQSVQHTSPHAGTYCPPATDGRRRSPVLKLRRAFLFFRRIGFR